jgi:hypothetical protein
VVRRWQQLPLDHALSRVGAVRALVDELAHAAAPGRAVPDLGPAVVMDQLTVLVYDTCAAGADDEAAARQTEAATRHTDPAGLATRLADLRRALA